MNSKSKMQNYSSKFKIDAGKPTDLSCNVRGKHDFDLQFSVFLFAFLTFLCPTNSL